MYDLSNKGKPSDLEQSRRLRAKWERRLAIDETSPETTREARQLDRVIDAFDRRAHPRGLVLRSDAHLITCDLDVDCRCTCARCGRIGQELSHDGLCPRCDVEVG